MKPYLTNVAKIFFLFAFLYILRNEPSALYRAVFNAYIEIGVFVTITLLVIYFFEHYTKNAMMIFLTRHQKIQVAVSSFLGALPGCGGAIIVVTQHSKGCMTFGSMVAALIASMGDAGILLLQKKPIVALVLFIICIVVATIVGYIVDFFSKEKFAKVHTQETHDIPIEESGLPFWALVVWLALFIASAIVYFSPNVVVDFFGGKSAIYMLNTAGIVSTILIWLFKSPHCICSKPACVECKKNVLNKVVVEVSFIVSWIFIAILVYEAISLTAQFDVASFINKNIHYTPFLTAIIGLIPGCGPQIIVTTFYINGMIPFSAQISNALSNSGDALLPTIALQPKKALVATVYSFVTALLVGYFIFFISIYSSQY